MNSEATFLMFAVTYEASNHIPEKPGLVFQKEQMIRSHFREEEGRNQFSSLIRKGTAARLLHAVFGNIYYIYNFVARCTSFSVLSLSFLFVF